MSSKDQLRKQIIDVRNEIAEPNYQLRSASICVLIQNFLDDLEFQTVHGYLPFRKEVDILPLLQRLHRSGKTILTSIIENEHSLSHVQFDPNGTLAEGKFGVPTPMLHTPFSGIIDVVLVPGVVFDHDGNRIGYGAGYYDRFLKNYPDATKIGVCFVEQIDVDLPTDPHDISMDIVISD